MRAGICIIVFFICQILLKVNRYCVKFALFYIGLFDTLIAHEEFKLSLSDAMKIFMPKIEVGDILSPTSDLAQILASSAKGNPSK